MLVRRGTRQTPRLREQRAKSDWPSNDFARQSTVGFFELISVRSATAHKTARAAQMKANAFPDYRPFFFDSGLRFSCTRCGRCCSGAPGTVFINQSEAARIARHLGLSQTDFLEKFAYPFKSGHSLKERPNGDCIFLQNGRCSIYRVRPIQCRTYPFWPENLQTPEAWEKEARHCPGIGAGRLHSREEILKLLQRALEAEGK